MMNKKKWLKGNVSSTKIDTVIGQGTRITGDVHFSGSLHIDGFLKGDVRCEANEDALMVVSDSGVVEGELHVPNLVVDGHIRGDVYISNHLVLGEHARVEGNVQYRTMEMVVGSEVNGSMTVNSRVKISDEINSQPGSKGKTSASTANTARAESLKQKKTVPVS